MMMAADDSGRWQTADSERPTEGNRWWTASGKRKAAADDNGGKQRMASCRQKATVEDNGAEEDNGAASFFLKQILLVFEESYTSKNGSFSQFLVKSKIYEPPKHQLGKGRNPFKKPGDRQKIP